MKRTAVVVISIWVLLVSSAGVAAEIALGAGPDAEGVAKRAAPAHDRAGPILKAALQGPLREVQEIVFAVRVPGRVSLSPGETARLAWPKDACHVFDAQSGRRRDDIPTTGVAG